MRTVNIGTKHYTKVVAMDKPGPGNACQEYAVVSIEDKKTLTKVNFQKGPIKETGINGCYNEDLIAMVIDRLEGFQTSKFKCKENAKALIYLKETLAWLYKRTQDRIERGVEGTSIK